MVVSVNVAAQVACQHLRLTRHKAERRFLLQRMLAPFLLSLLPTRLGEHAVYFVESEPPAVQMTEIAGPDLAPPVHESKCQPVGERRAPPSGRAQGSAVKGQSRWEKAATADRAGAVSQAGSVMSEACIRRIKARSYRAAACDPAG